MKPPARKVHKLEVGLVRGADGRWRKAGIIDRLLLRTITVKKDCTTGRFVSPTVVARGCAAPAAPAPWDRARPGDRRSAAVYASRGELLRAFVAWNQPTIDAAGGLDRRHAGATFDSVNERHNLKGSRKVETLRRALELSAPPAPFKMRDFDLEAVNELSGDFVGAGGFTLPPSDPTRAELRAHHAELAASSKNKKPSGGDDVPF